MQIAICEYTSIPMALIKYPPSNQMQRSNRRPYQAPKGNLEVKVWGIRTCIAKYTEDSRYTEVGFNIIMYYVLSPGAPDGTPPRTPTQGGNVEDARHVREQAGRSLWGGSEGVNNF
jgi:hypothetical protein